MRDFEQGDSWRNYFLKRKFAIANELEERGKGLWAWPKISPKNFPPHGSLTSFLTSAKRSEMVNCAIEADEWKSEGDFDESLRYTTQASLNFSLLRYYNAVQQRGISLRMRQESLFGPFGAISIFSARFCQFSTERSTPFCDTFWKGMKEYDKFTTISNSVDTHGVCWLFGWGYFNDQSANKTRK